MGQLDGKVAIVTGAAQGIGAHYALGLAEQGAKVVIADILDTAASAAAVTAAGGEAMGVHCDVTDDPSVQSMVDGIMEKWGRIDILVNNAALFGTLPTGPFEDISSDAWDAVMRVNVRGVWQCCKAVVPVMRVQKYGKIINVASGTVFKGIPDLLHYVSSKGAIIALTRALAREVGDDNICINAVAPGLTESENVAGNASYDGLPRDMNVASRCFKREELPEDIVGPVLFLASPASDFMTGQTMAVDGGSAMH